MEQAHYCIKCGKLIDPGDRYCKACGQPIEGSVDTHAAAKPYPEVRHSNVSTYASTSIRATWALNLLGGFGLVAVVSVLSTIAEIGLLQRIADGSFISEAELTANKDRQTVIGLVWLIIYIATVVAFCLWIHRASSNLKALNVEEQRFSPGWAVGWWFIPIFNLFRPYQVMKEIWRGSAPITSRDTPHSWVNTPISPLLGWWWASWVIWNWIDWRSIRLVWRGETAEELITANQVVLVGNALTIVAGVLVFVLIRQISANQEKKYQQLVRG